MAQLAKNFSDAFWRLTDIEVENGGRVSPTDLRVGSVRFEVKTASLGANGTFQFNHVRMDRDYEYLLCLGICPNHVVFEMWRKGVVAENRAGRLVRMAEGQAVTYKLTKRLDDMESIAQLPDRIRHVIDENRGN